MSFHDMRLAEPIVRAVNAAGYSAPTPIQARAIPEAMAGRDVLGCAQTGTGKTCAFALPILHRLAGGGEQPGKMGRKGRSPRALVLCPTRELASQIFDSFVEYGRGLKLRHAVVFGGVNQVRQVRALNAGVDVLVATPGRLLDLIGQGLIELDEIEVLVLDEADRMLDMGFIHDIRRVVDMIPEQRQSLLFSATVSKEIRRLADSILREPVVIETAPESTTVELVSQRVYLVERSNKPVLLEQFLRREEVRRTLVFTRTKHGADKLVKVLRRAEIDADAIHGNKSQNARTRAMNAFRAGQTAVLVATDVAARGIDVDDITHVVNYDMPIDPETYVHRVGRTARAGASGVAVSFCDRDEVGVLRAIERRTRIRMEVSEDAPELAFAASSVSQHERPQRGGARNSGGGGSRAARTPPRGGRTGGRGPGGGAGKPAASGRSRRAGASRGARAGGGRSQNSRSR